MRALANAGFAAILAVSGCAAMKPTSTGAASGSAQAPADSGPQSPPAAPPASPALESSVAAMPPPVNAAAGATPATTQPSAAARPVKQAGAAAASPRGSTTPAQPSGKPPAPVKQPAPAATAPKSTLNLTDLERRLRDTPAIGVFTKLSLKNQVDDLLKAFRDLYRDPNRRPTAELRQRYDLLLLKVLSLLQDSDPPLAAAIAASREAIWSILADPIQFAKI